MNKFAFILCALCIGIIMSQNAEAYYYYNYHYAAHPAYAAPIMPTAYYTPSYLEPIYNYSGYYPSYGWAWNWW